MNEVRVGSAQDLFLSAQLLSPAESHRRGARETVKISSKTRSLDSARREVYGIFRGRSERPEGTLTRRGSSAEDGVQARLGPGSLKSSQDLRCT